MWNSAARFGRHLLAASLFGAALLVTLTVTFSGTTSGVFSSAAAAPAATAATVTGVRFGDRSKTLTRVVLDLSDKVQFSVFTLSDPYRVVVDLPEIAWDIPKISSVAGVVKQFRYGLFKAGNSRLVFDVEGPVTVKKAFVLESNGGSGPRLVLDLEKVSPAAFLKAQKSRPRPPPAPSASPPLPTAPPPSSSAGDVALLPLAPGSGDLAPGTPKPPRKPGKRTIVLDPGHGGVDPGATGKSGRFEKAITLAMAKELKKKFEATGRYRVVLTRNRDIFIRLRGRLAKARQADGDLFISLHADSIKNRSIRGLSVYTLSETASDKEAAALAKSENKSDVIAGIDLTYETPEVTNILIDLAQRETMNLSAHFANLLITDIRRKVKVLHKTHRFAGFAVLKAPDIPSVLVELGYLSNAGEERLLRDPKYRGKLGAAIVAAVDKFFAWKDNMRRS
ncbi:MAG: N-acetylmuramoyl-L-alanine amidase [Alphaproteobacteria bacterium]|nr:N-acetylmuramoyl-L-alanine amidase [Alphaproteobacteria bacterium]